MNWPVAVSLRVFRTLTKGFPQEFQNAYGAEMHQATEDALEPVWRRYGVFGLVRLLIDVAVRIVVEYASELRHDIRYGLRMLAASPGFTAVALLSLTLGIGVATSAFSEMNGFVLRDVPAISKPDELVAVLGPTSYLHYQRYRERSDLFSSTLAYVAPVPFGVSLGGPAERIWGHLVAPGYFATLGVVPALGRWFGKDEEQPGGAATVVISHQFWRHRLGSDPLSIGRPLRVNGYSCTIIGIGPPDFRGASPMAYGADVWLPISVGALLAPELADNALERHDRLIFHVAGRLRPIVPPARAEAALDTIFRQVEQEHGDLQRNQKGRRLLLVPGGKLLPFRKQDLPFVTGFFAVLGGMILLIASSNVANMVLARATDRRREIAVRLALGASRFRLVRQLLTESMMIAIGAGMLGLLMASLLMRAASQMRMMYPMPLTLNLQPDGRVLLFTLLLTAFTGLAFGLVPALRATRTDLSIALKEGAILRLRRYRGLSLRNLLVVCQTAGSLSLLLITGILVIGHQKIAGTHVGFDAENLHLIALDPVRDGYSGAQATAFFEKLLDRVRGLPSVTGASLADSVPMAMIARPGVMLSVEGPNGSRTNRSGRKFTVAPDYFQTIGIPLLRGRPFRKEDEANDSTAAIVSEKLARECWKGQDPLGRRIEVGDTEVPRFEMGGSVSGGGPRISVKPQVFQVVGVAKDVRDGLTMVPADGPGVIYLPLRPAAYARPGLHGITLVARATPGVDAIGMIRREISALDDKLMPFQARSMVTQIDEMMAPVRGALWTYACIGIFGLILASVGVAGVTAYAVSQRRREIGIRMALGAKNGSVIRLVMKQGAVLVMVGSLIGLAAGWAGVRILSSILFTIAKTARSSLADPRVLISAPLLLITLALLACYLPARKSLRIDPAVSLRQD